MKNIFLTLALAGGLTAGLSSADGYWTNGTTGSSGHYTENYVAKSNIKERVYQLGVTADEIKDIRFIVTTLGNTPLLKLKSYKNALEAAGDRVDHVHPLNFWRAIFTDNEMISAMHSIKRRSLVWKKFMSGMGKSLQEEKDNKNLRPEYVEDFCSQVGVDSEPVTIHLSNENWKGFVRFLLDQVSREGDSDRYDL